MPDSRVSRLFPVLLLLSSASAAAVLDYSSPYCGPAGGSTPWACGAWPTTTPPALGREGTVTIDPDTRNRVLRATQAGSFGEDPATAFKVFDAGWRRAWNATGTRFIVVPWTSRGQVRNQAYWLAFDPSSMRLDGRAQKIPADLSDIEWDQ
jgi:hypothetical protein